MLKFLKMLLKIILAPFILLLSFAIFIFSKVFGFVAGLAVMLSGVFAIFGVYCLFDPVYNWSAAPALISAFLLSPIGIPLLGGILVVSAENFRDWLKAI